MRCKHTHNRVMEKGGGYFYSPGFLEAHHSFMLCLAMLVSDSWSTWRNMTFTWLKKKLGNCIRKDLMKF